MWSITRKDHGRMTRYHAEHHKTRRLMLMMEVWKRYMGYLPAVCGFPPGIVQELPRMIQMPAAISRQTEKQMMQNSLENISMTKRALGIIIMVSIHFKLNDLWHPFYGFIKLKWQENMRGSLKYTNILAFMRLHPVAEHIIFPLLNILLIANWKIQSLCMQIFNGHQLMRADIH